MSEWCVRVDNNFYECRIALSISIYFGMNKKTSLCTPQAGRSFHLTQKVDYALFLLSVLAQQTTGNSQSLRMIAKKYTMSFAFLQKVAGLLARGGFIKGTRGKQGGYVLDRTPRSLSVKEIVEAVDGPIQIMGCLSRGVHKKDASCPRMQLCSVRSHLASLNQKIVTSYHNKKLSDIVKTLSL